MQIQIQIVPQNQNEMTRETQPSVRNLVGAERIENDKTVYISE